MYHKHEKKTMKDDVKLSPKKARRLSYKHKKSKSHRRSKKKKVISQTTIVDFITPLSLCNKNIPTKKVVSSQCSKKVKQYEIANDEFYRTFVLGNGIPPPDLEYDYLSEYEPVSSSKKKAPFCHEYESDAMLSDVGNEMDVSWKKPFHDTELELDYNFI